MKKEPFKFWSNLSMEKISEILADLSKDLKQKGLLGKSEDLVEEMDEKDKKTYVTLNSSFDKNTLKLIVQALTDKGVLDPKVKQFDMASIEGATGGKEPVAINFDSLLFDVNDATLTPPTKKDEDKPKDKTSEGTKDQAPVDPKPEDNNKPKDNKKMDTTGNKSLKEYRRLMSRKDQGEELTFSEQFFCDSIEKTFDEAEKAKQAPKVEDPKKEPELHDEGKKDEPKTDPKPAKEEPKKEDPKPAADPTPKVEEPKKEDPIKPKSETKTFDDLLFDLEEPKDYSSLLFDEAELKDKDPEPKKDEPKTDPKPATDSELHDEGKKTEPKKCFKIVAADGTTLVKDGFESSDEAEAYLKGNPQEGATVKEYECTLHDDPKPAAEPEKKEDPKVDEGKEDPKPKKEDPKPATKEGETKKEYKDEGQYRKEKFDVIKELNKKHAGQTLEGIARENNKI